MTAASELKALADERGIAQEKRNAAEAFVCEQDPALKEAAARGEYSFELGIPSGIYQDVLKVFHEQGFATYSLLASAAYHTRKGNLPVTISWENPS